MRLSSNNHPPIENIYKINEILLNQNKKKLSIAYNSGIIIYSLNDFEMLSISNDSDYNFGNISHCSMIYNSSTVVFTGSKNNTKYNNNQVVFYDLDAKKEINSLSLKEEIRSINVLFSFLIISTENSIQVFSFKEESYIPLIGTIDFENKNKQLPFLVFTSENNEVTRIHICLVSQKDNEIAINSFFSNDFVFEKKENITLVNFNGIQRMFHLKEHNLLLVVETNGQYFSGIDITTKERKYEFYRGTTSGNIIDACELTNDHIAVVNMIKTIHIFKLKEKSGGILSYLIPNFIYSSYIYSSIKIKLSDIIKNEDLLYYKENFEKKGLIIFNNNNNNEQELVIVGYHGYFYRLKLDYENLKYIITESSSFISDQFQSKSVFLDSSGKEYFGTDSKEKWSII
jgi:hypothetical protein